uniref:Uncharacterized protein n=1 Tax=Micrurus corallinus TaxID=54390 RepID=A0A2D4FLE3_MICCO
MHFWFCGMFHFMSRCFIPKMIEIFFLMENRKEKEPYIPLSGDFKPNVQFLTHFLFFPQFKTGSKGDPCSGTNSNVQVSFSGERTSETEKGLFSLTAHLISVSADT